MTEGLKACPNPWCEFPNGNGVAHHKRDGWRVVCNCGVATPRFASRDEAIAAWNTRPVHSPMPGREDQIRNILWKHLGGDDRYPAIREALNEILALSPRSDELVEALKDVLASLVAAMSIIDRATEEKKDPRKVVASDKMLLQMMGDYQKSIEHGRRALLASASPRPNNVHVQQR